MTNWLHIFFFKFMLLNLNSKNMWMEYQKKMSFNPDSSKQAQEVKFYRKMRTLFHLQIFTGKVYPQVKLGLTKSVNMDIWVVFRVWPYRNWHMKDKIHTCFELGMWWYACITEYFNSSFLLIKLTVKKDHIYCYVDLNSDQK